MRVAIGRWAEVRLPAQRCSTKHTPGSTPGYDLVEVLLHLRKLLAVGQQLDALEAKWRLEFAGLERKGAGPGLEANGERTHLEVQFTDEAMRFGRAPWDRGIGCN